MTAATKKGASESAPAAWENPLIPNKKLKALYVAMVELRLLGEHLFPLKRRQRSSVESHTATGEDGCRVSTTFDLKPGDLTSDGGSEVATSFLRGTKLAEVIHHAQLSSSGGREASGAGLPATGELPNVSNAVERLHIAMGAASALKVFRKGPLVIAYVHTGEIALLQWKPVLRFAAEHVLPMIFVVLPSASAKRAGELSLAATKCGVPGIPVDAADPVALFRVAQESMLRARAGGGPVLMECIPFVLAGKKTAAADPIETMREFLLHRKIVNEAWLHGVETRFQARLKTAPGR